MNSQVSVINFEVITNCTVLNAQLNISYANPKSRPPRHSLSLYACIRARAESRPVFMAARR